MENDFQNYLELVKLNCTNFRVHSLSNASTHHSVITQSHNTTEARRLKPYMSQLETLGGANQLRYRGFGQLQLIYILELSNSSFPKSFSPTSISWYPSIYNRLLLGFCFLWENTFFNSILETQDFVR